MDINKPICCPACGYLTLKGGYGRYAICVVCGWKDDAVQLANPCSVGGANAASLAYYQQNTVRLALIAGAQDGYIKDPKWCPLSQYEIEYFDNIIAEKGHWNANGNTPPYWEF